MNAEQESISQLLEKVEDTLATTVATVDSLVRTTREHQTQRALLGLMPLLEDLFNAVRDASTPTKDAISETTDAPSAGSREDGRSCEPKPSNL